MCGTRHQSLQALKTFGWSYKQLQFEAIVLTLSQYLTKSAASTMAACWPLLFHVFFAEVTCLLMMISLKKHAFPDRFDTRLFQGLNFLFIP